MKGLNRRGWFFEVRHSRLHIATYRKLPGLVLFLLTSVGIGITFLTWLDDYFQQNGRIRYQVDISDHGAQADLEHTLRWSPFARSLSIRSQRHLDLTQIQKMRSMKLLWISGPMKTNLNLSQLTNLRLLGAGRSVTKVSGLDSLGRLHYVHVGAPTQTWVNRLPATVKRLFITKSNLEKLDLSELRKLEVLGFTSLKNISARNYLLPENLKQLDLVQVSTVVDVDFWLESCQKLNKINIDTCPSELVSSIAPLAQKAGVSLEVG